MVWRPAGSELYVCQQSGQCVVRSEREASVLCSVCVYGCLCEQGEARGRSVQRGWGGCGGAAAAARGRQRLMSLT